MSMTTLDRRDRRRAKALIETILKNHSDRYRPLQIFKDCPDCTSPIAKALKREREETGFAAIGHLFAKSAQKAAIRAFEAKHGKVKR